MKEDGSSATSNVRDVTDVGEKEDGRRKTEDNLLWVEILRRNYELK
jgi:hypothetical protein